MKKSLKILLLVAASLVLLGGVAVGTALALGGSFEPMETREMTHTVGEDFRHVVVRVGEADVRILPSEDGTCYAVCDENDLLQYTLTVEDERLTLSVTDSRRWYHFIGITWGRAKTVILYLPAAAYDSLDVLADSGNIVCTDAKLSFEDATLESSAGRILFSSPVRNALRADAASGRIELSELSPKTLTATTYSGNIVLSALTVGTLEASARSGRISLSDLTADTLRASTISGGIELAYVRGGDLSMEATSGSVQLRDVLASASLAAETKSGNIRLDACDAPSITLTSSSGSVTGTLLSDKLFDVQSTTGSENCPPSIRDGGSCTVRTSSGDIRLSVVSE